MSLLLIVTLITVILVGLDEGLNLLEQNLKKFYPKKDFDNCMEYFTCNSTYWLSVE